MGGTRDGMTLTGWIMSKDKTTGIPTRPSEGERSEASETWPAPQRSGHQSGACAHNERRHTIAAAGARCCASIARLADRTAGQTDGKSRGGLSARSRVQSSPCFSSLLSSDLKVLFFAFLSCTRGVSLQQNLCTSHSVSVLFVHRICHHQQRFQDSRPTRRKRRTRRTPDDVPSPEQPPSRELKGQTASQTLRVDRAMKRPEVDCCPPPSLESFRLRRRLTSSRPAAHCGIDDDLPRSPDGRHVIWLGLCR